MKMEQKTELKAKTKKTCHECDEDQFECGNGHCVPKCWKCDGMDDCGDNSDEEHCNENGCGGGQFTCLINCKPAHWECDGMDDCGDNSDEEHCNGGSGGCGDYEFTCANGYCKPADWECDGMDDCGDNSDEEHCNGGGCGVGEFTCTNGNCKPADWECDGMDDCGDNSDEEHCNGGGCGVGEFTCINGNCIPADWECDGMDDCGDNSDEEHCNGGGCGVGEFTCTNGNCKPADWECDGMDDCGDNSDEEQCNGGGCGGGQFTCAKGNCIPAHWECDGMNDCEDNSDEEHCGDGGEGVEWSAWSEWGPCSVSGDNCGTGERSRTRQCLNTGNTGCMHGESVEYQLCATLHNCVEADSGCGSRIIASEPRIVGGQNALPGEWPWQAQLYSIANDIAACGGTLVGPRHVVSAAHCFDNPPNPTAWKVRLGRYTRGRPLSAADSQSVEVDVVKIILHEDYDKPVDSDNDIALLTLSNDVDTSDFINYACLDKQITFSTNSSCFVTGWGTLHQGGFQPNILQEAVVPILPDDICRTLNGQTSITDNMMCAGYIAGGIDSCQGDSGGPLVCIHTHPQTGISRWYLAGVTSWGYGCAQANNPGVYTRVPRYYTWLQDHGVML
ncbi:uncharacterized protein LOC100367197 [Saccoglossus kowalevskii]